MVADGTLPTVTGETLLLTHCRGVKEKARFVEGVLLNMREGRRKLNWCLGGSGVHTADELMDMMEQEAPMK
eukprot:1354750-Lingulodinium_polyedra.AAC.1